MALSNDLHILAQLASIAAVVLCSGHVAERVLTPWRQGFIRTGYTMAAIAGAAAGGYVLCPDPALSVAVAGIFGVLVAAVVMVMVMGSVRRQMLAMARMRQALANARATTAAKVRSTDNHDQ